MYSNCLLEAIKAKFRNKNIKILYIPSKINNNHIHFFWFDGVNYFHFTNTNIRRTNLWFNGEIRSFEKRVFCGFILMKLYNSKTPIEKAVRICKKLLLNLTADDIKDYYETSDLDED